MGRRLLSILILGMGLQMLCVNTINAQIERRPLNLSLKNVVDLAITQSTSIKYVQNRNVRSYWRWKNFQTGFMPQLILSGDLPNFTHTTEPITQPDGSIEFKNVANAQMYANLALSQSIAATGTQIYAASSVYRIEDYNTDKIEYSGTVVCESVSIFLRKSSIKSLAQSKYSSSTIIVLTFSKSIRGPILREP